MASQPTFRRTPSAGLQRLLLKVPPLVYHGPLAEMMRWRCVMVLTTIGRRSGRPRSTGISFMPLGERLIVFAGWGVSANWYRNVSANPEVVVKVGRRRMRATARLVADPQRRAELMRQMQARSDRCGPPKLARPLLRATGIFDYDADIRMAVAQGGELPVVEITPHS